MIYCLFFLYNFVPGSNQFLSEEQGGENHGSFSLGCHKGENKDLKYMEVFLLISYFILLTWQIIKQACIN